MNRAFSRLLPLSALVLLSAAACGDDSSSTQTTSSSSSASSSNSSSSSSGAGGMGAGGMGAGGMGTGGMGTGGMGAGGMGAGGMGAGGMGAGGGMLDGTNNLFYYGDFVTNNTYNAGYYDGMTQLATTLTLANLDGTDINAMALSPDGTQLVLSGHDTNGNTDYVYLYNVPNFAAATTLADTTASGFVVDISEIAFSPDGSRIAFLGDIDSNNEDAAYVVPTDGSTPPVLVSPVPPDGQDVKSLVWVNNTTLAYVGDVVTADHDGLWAVDVTAVTPTPVDLLAGVTLSATQGLEAGYLGVDAQGRIYFRSNHVVEATNQLFRVDANGANLTQVPGTAIMANNVEQAIAGWNISPNGTLLAFATVPSDGEVGQVYMLDLSMATATAVTNFNPGTPPTGVQWGANDDQIGWSPDQTMVAFAGDWPLLAGDADNSNGLFVAPVANNSAVRVTGPLMQDPLLSAFNGRFSSDGSSLFIRGDLVSDGEADVFVTADFTTTDQDPSALQIVACPESGDVFDMVPTP